MTAFTEMFKVEWQCEKITICTVMTSTVKNISQGQLNSHTTKMLSLQLLMAYKIFQCPYSDEGEPYQGNESSISLFCQVKFGLEMHIVAKAASQK